ncbi:MAG: glycoside hydrolase family 16 protein [Opitutales bacterium]|nr:glycoside hydrolase family 16 protein [Opitutales bacterium]
MNAKILSLAMLLLAGSAAHASVVWQDEFNGPRIDTDTWVWDVGQHGFGNGQLEYNTSRAKNSYIENGNLVIEAFREDHFGMAFTSARLNTQGRFAFKYGTLEARIKMPDTANGLWPAFWMLGNNFPGVPWPDAGEIDIVEMGAASGIAEGKQQQRINSAIHYANSAGDYEYVAAWYDAPFDLSQDYHLYKVEWTPESLSFYLDDVLFASWDITASHFTEFHQPHFIILNLAVGGWDDSYTGVTTPAGVTALPTPGSSARMYIDWIRLEENPYTEIFLGADTEETGNFGVFTETTPVNNALVFGDDSAPDFVYGPEAALFTWNNMTESAVSAEPSEGSEAWTFDIGAADWFGMGVFLPNFRNMKNYSDGFLHFDIKTTLTSDIRIGIKSSRGGESWQAIGTDGTTGPGFARDGQWHTVSVPLNGYSNIDFNTIHQIFMIVGEPASASTTLAIDNVYWEPSVERPRPSSGNFGVFTETPEHRTAGSFELGVDGEFFIWGETLVPIAQDPYEGEESLSFTSAPGLQWFGAAFTSAVKYDLSAWDTPNATLNFSMRTTSTATFYIGMKSGNLIGPPPVWGGNNDGPDGVGQVWIKFAPGSDPYGFVRDGNWHAIEIPIEDIVGDTDLSQVNVLFQILGVDGAISNIELDDIYYAGGRAFETIIVPSIVERGVGLSWPSTNGSMYVVQWATELGPEEVWQSLTDPIEGDWTRKTVFDSLESGERKFYRVMEMP